MYVFLDTEFTDFKDCDLISLGLVSEDNLHEFYAEITDHTESWQSDFVKQTVVPLLENQKYGKEYNAVAQDLKEWFDTLPAEKIIVIVDYSMDAQLLFELMKAVEPTQRQIMIQMLDPSFRHVLHERGFHMPKELANGWLGLMQGMEDYYENVDDRRHHALVDAKANRHGWMQGLEYAKQA